MAKALSNDPSLWRQFPELLRGAPELIQIWLENRGAGRISFCLFLIFAGAGSYGAAMGMWRAGEQALFTAIKFPLILLLTAGGNALLNGMLAPLLGLPLGFRQSFLAMLMSFAILATLLGAFSPLLFFLVWNAPPLSVEDPMRGATYHEILIIQVAIIAYSGYVANVRLTDMLRQKSGHARIAQRVLIAWLAGNLFLGSQLVWILRPFIGAPHLAVEFLRPDAFKGNFFESVFLSFCSLFLT